MTSQVRPDGTTVTFAYDEGGKMTRLVTPSGAVHGFESSPRGARTGHEAPLSGSYAYAYDGAGRLATVTSPSGDTVTNTYSGELLSSTSFAGGTIGYTHLPCGKLDSTTRGAETSRLTYDGPLVTREVRTGSVPATPSFAYDTDLRPTQFRYAEATQTYTYDADGLIVTAAPFTVSRDASSGLATAVTAPGFALQRTYSEYGEIDAAASTASGYALTRDAAGRITSKTETTSAGAHTWVYAYDGLGRLSVATRDGQLAESYSYDAQGNRTAMRAPVRGIADTVTAVFDAEDRAVRIGDAAYAFTDDGYLASRTTSAGATSYAYTGLGELASVTLEDGRVVSYAYDAAGRRVARSLDGAVVERYLWADTTRLLATYDAAGTLTRRFLYADARTPYAMDTPGGATSSPTIRWEVSRPSPTRQARWSRPTSATASATCWRTATRASRSPSASRAGLRTPTPASRCSAPATTTRPRAAGARRTPSASREATRTCTGTAWGTRWGWWTRRGSSPTKTDTWLALAPSVSAGAAALVLSTMTMATSAWRAVSAIRADRYRVRACHTRCSTPRLTRFRTSGVRALAVGAAEASSLGLWVRSCSGVDAPMHTWASISKEA